MAINENFDYVFCPAATYIGAVGVGKGCLVGTKKYLLGLPERIEEGVWNESITVTTYTLAGKPPGETIQDLAQVMEMGLATFEGTMEKLSRHCEGAVFVDLEAQKRVKVRAGFLSKGIYWSDRESGPGWKGYGLGAKPLAQKWVEFYKELPNAI